MKALRSFLPVFLCIAWTHLCIGVVDGDGCHTQHNGCCVVCNPGYSLDKKCGPCIVCQPKTYMEVINTGPTCKQCRLCEGIFEYRSLCSTTKNAVCKCISGKKCADQECTQCEDNPCPAGTEIIGEVCVKCPHGTFNPGSEGTCLPWKNCSAINAVIYVNGTSTADVVCLPKPTKIPSTSLAATRMTTKPEEVPGYELSVIIVAISVLTIILISIGIFLCLSLRLEKIKMKFKQIKQTEQEDACSCHYPEEENGEESRSLDP